MINQLGVLNFTDLAGYIWKAGDDATYENYLKNQLKELIVAHKTPGIVYGGAISVTTGMAISIAKLLALFSTGELATMDVGTLNLTVGDATNPRIDRIEAAFALVDNASVSIDDPSLGVVTKVLDRFVSVSLSINQGTPAGSPSAPARTAGRISLGLVSVAANQVILTQPNVSQSNTAADFSSTYLADTNHLMRINQTTGAFEFSVDGNNFYPVALNTIGQGSFAIANSVGSQTNITGLLLDSTKFKSAKISVDLYRSTSSVELSAAGDLYATYYPTLAAWKISQNLYGDDDLGVDFFITAGGQVQYKSDTQAGSGYTGVLRFKVASLNN